MVTTLQVHWEQFWWVLFTIHEWNQQYFQAKYNYCLFSSCPIPFIFSWMVILLMPDHSLKMFFITFVSHGPKFLAKIPMFNFKGVLLLSFPWKRSCKRAFFDQTTPTRPLSFQWKSRPARTHRWVSALAKRAKKESWRINWFQCYKTIFFWSLAFRE